jgi:uncharacterized membrane protein
MAGARPAVSAERLLVFGDALFAVAITLLALSITVPSGLSSDGLNTALHNDLPALGAYALTFAVLAVLWLAHHGLYRMIAHLDAWLLWLDLAFLAVVVVFPFPSRLLSQYGSTFQATSIYAGTIAVASALIAAMAVRLLVHPAARDSDATRERVELTIARSAVIVLVFLGSIPVALASAGAAKIVWAAAVPLRWALNRRTGRDVRVAT